MKILAIDVGVRNMGLALCDEHRILDWRVEPLQRVNAGYLPGLNVTYVLDFVNHHSELFAQADVVLIERQMRVNMRIIESVLHALHYDKTVILLARTVKKHFDLCQRNYRANKRAAVNYVKTRLENDWYTQFMVQGKQDDMADALLMAWYWADRRAQNNLSSRTAAAPGAEDAHSP